jgi:hypothetical protein
VDDHVGAEVQRVLEVGSEEGVVDNEECLLLLANLSDASDVADSESRVGGSLSPDDLGVRLDGLSDKVKVSEVDEIDLDSLSLRKYLSKISLGTAVDIVNAEDVVTGGEEVGDGEESRAAAVESEGILCVLEGGEVALEAESRGIATTSIVEAHRLTRVGLSEGGREIDGRGDTAELAVGLIAAVDGASGETAINQSL